MVDGDENTSFFHGYVNNRNRRNRRNKLSGLMINGVWTTDPVAIKEEVHCFFQHKFLEKWPSRPKFTSPMFHRISPAECMSLEVPFPLDEIKAAIWARGSEKAPGPNGFTFKFLKSYWEMIKGDVWDLVKHFEESGRIARARLQLVFYNSHPKD